MHITSNFFKVIDSDKECLLINSKRILTGTVSAEIRNVIELYLEKDIPTIYLNAKNVEVVDLTGINEVIHTHYVLQQAYKKLVFVYKKNSKVEKWVAQTGLDKFIETAIVV